jgi:ubiquinone/menaquinone biosynthesis C-methylase UbiE
VPRPVQLRRHYAKVCDVADFEDPGFRARGQELRPEIDLSWQFDRKNWESIMATFLFEEAGVLDGARVLSVGAGREAVLFWIAERAARTVAVDVYGQGEFASTDAPAGMLTDPGAYSPFGRPLPGLEVMSLDARSMPELEDASFDAIYSLSSIEHFGSPADIRAAAAEIGRLLRPGGYAYLATELVLESAPAPLRAARGAINRASGGRWMRRELFTRPELISQLVEPSGLQLLQPVHTRISEASFANKAVKRLRSLRYPQGCFHPHIVLQIGGDVFTSVGLPLYRAG